MARTPTVPNIVDFRLLEMERKFSVNEVFGPTIQGEGPLAGARTHFIRFNGCDYRCTWCDTLDAVDPEQIKLHHHPMSATDILEAIKALPPAKWITVSGGNPALLKHLDKVIELLQEAGHKVAIETQASISQEWFAKVDYMILSPKPPSSGMTVDWNAIDRCLTWSPAGKRAFKVVVFTATDLVFAKEIRQAYRNELFYLQVGCPQSKPEPGIIEMTHGYQRLVHAVLSDPEFADVFVLPQLHKYLFGHGRGV